MAIFVQFTLMIFGLLFLQNQFSCNNN